MSEPKMRAATGDRPAFATPQRRVALNAGERPAPAFSKCLMPASAFRLHFADARSASHAGWTFGSFIAACRAAGLKDSDPLAAIDFGNGIGGSRCVSAEMDDELTGFVVREDR